VFPSAAEVDLELLNGPARQIPRPN